MKCRGSSLFGFFAADFEDFQHVGQTAFPHFAAFADRRKLGLNDIVQKFLYLYVAETAAGVMRLQLVKICIFGQIFGKMRVVTERIKLNEHGVALNLSGILHPQMVGVGEH